MRAVHIHVRSAEAGHVLSVASAHRAFSAVAVQVSRSADAAQPDGEDWSLLFVHVSNDRVGHLIDGVRRVVKDARFVIEPVESLALGTPVSEVNESVRSVARLSTIELVIASLQSIGSWLGLLMFSVLAGVIGAYALIFDIAYLVVAAMLINPMGSSLLVSVVGVTIGDALMWRRGLGRFVAALAVQAAAALGVGLLYGLSVSTATMEQVTALSSWGVVVAFAAGAAGMQAQVKSDRDSLVSGSAAGFMVAAALAPPTSVLGLSVALGRWDYVGLMAFLLSLQYVAVTAGGWTALTIYGVRTGDPAVERGRPRVRTILLALACVASVGLVLWQKSLEPRFLKADLTRVALEISTEAVNAISDAALVESAARFTRQDVRRQQAMLVEIIVERKHGIRSDDAIAANIRSQVESRTERRMKGVIPFVNVTVLPAPQRLPRSDQRRSGQ